MGSRLGAFRGDIASIKGVDMEVVATPGGRRVGRGGAQGACVAFGGGHVPDIAGARAHALYMRVAGCWAGCAELLIGLSRSPLYPCVRAVPPFLRRAPRPTDLCLCTNAPCMTEVGTPQCTLPTSPPGAPPPPPVPTGVRAVLQAGRQVKFANGTSAVYNGTVDAAISTQYSDSWNFARARVVLSGGFVGRCWDRAWVAGHVWAPARGAWASEVSKVGWQQRPAAAERVCRLPHLAAAHAYAQRA